jgi:hypothetical protein
LGILSRRGPALLVVPPQNKQIFWIPALEDSMGVLSYGYCYWVAIINQHYSHRCSFSLTAASNNVAWGIPLLCLVLWGHSRFSHTGPFYIGRFSVAVSILALLYLTFATILCMFPSQGPYPDRESTVSSFLVRLCPHIPSYLSIYFSYPIETNEKCPTTSMTRY